MSQDKGRQDKGLRILLSPLLSFNYVRNAGLPVTSAPVSAATTGEVATATSAEAGMSAATTTAEVPAAAAGEAASC